MPPFRTGPSLARHHHSSATVTVPKASDFAVDASDMELITDAVRLVAEFVRENRHLRFTVPQLAAAMGDAEGADAAGGTRCAVRDAKGLRISDPPC